MVLLDAEFCVLWFSMNPVGFWFLMCHPVIYFYESFDWSKGNYYSICSGLGEGWSLPDIKGRGQISNKIDMYIIKFDIMCKFKDESL